MLSVLSLHVARLRVRCNRLAPGSNPEIDEVPIAADTDMRLEHDKRPRLLRILVTASGAMHQRVQATRGHEKPYCSSMSRMQAAERLQLNALTVCATHALLMVCVPLSVHDTL